MWFVFRARFSRSDRRCRRRGDAVVAAGPQRQLALLDPSPFIQTNLVGTFTLLEGDAPQGETSHHISTDEVATATGWTIPRVRRPRPTAPLALLLSERRFDLLVRVELRFSRR